VIYSAIMGGHVQPSGQNPGTPEGQRFCPDLAADGYIYFDAAVTIATIPARMAVGRLGHASISVLKSAGVSALQGKRRNKRRLR
jgi:hypothetical protein